MYNPLNLFDKSLKLRNICFVELKLMSIHRPMIVSGVLVVVLFQGFWIQHNRKSHNNQLSINRVGTKTIEVFSSSNTFSPYSSMFQMIYFDLDHFNWHELNRIQTSFNQKTTLMTSIYTFNCHRRHRMWSQFTLILKHNLVKTYA